MAKRAAHKDRGTPWMGLVILLLLVVIAAVIYMRWQQAGTPMVSGGAGADQTPDLISDQRMVYGGEPRASAGAGHEMDFELLKNIAYMVGYSEERRDPLWVAYRVFHLDPPLNFPRPTGKFLTDSRSADRVKHEDFTGSGYDRGHMAPNESIVRDFGQQAQIETFLLTNICPQSPELNEHVWERLEVKERAFGDELEEVWVIDGPIFGDLNGQATPRLASGIAVPEAFYKILIDETGKKGGPPRVMAVIMPQTVKGSELPQQFLTSIREIENETHLEFLWKLDAATRGNLESKAWPMWTP